MSSSASSSSSSDAILPMSQGMSEGAEQFGSMLDLSLPVVAVLGTGRISVRDCLALAPRSVLRLGQAAGEDLRIFVGSVAVALAEVVIVDDSTAIRLTEILPAGSSEGQ